MYELGPPFSGTVVEPGTNLLVTGPPLTGKRRLLLETLAVGTGNGDGIIVVSTRDSATRVRDEFATVLDEGAVPEIGIVDAVTQHIGRSTDAEMTKYTASPRDLSAIGIKFSEFIQSFYTDQQQEHNRVGVDSLTTLLLYSSLQTVFQFTHVFTSRVETVDGLGLYTIEATAHDSESLNTLGQLFDGRIVVDESGVATLELPGVETQTAQL